MERFDVTFAAPLEWIADQLQCVPLQPGRRAVVLVGAERQAHAIRRLLCLERGRPELLAGVLLLRPVELAREVLVRAGRVRVLGWEDVRRLRILQLFDSAVLDGTLRYFNAEQLRSGQGYGDAFARTIADLEASGLDAAGAAAVSDQLAATDRLAADRLHDVACTWARADAAAGPLTSSAQVLTEAAQLTTARPELLASFGPIFALLTASPSTTLLRFLRALPSSSAAVLQDARPVRTGTHRWRAFATSAPVTAVPPPAADASELQLAQRYVFELPEILTDPARPRSRGPDGSVDIEEYPSIEDEIEAAAIWVTEQIAAGCPAEQIALVVPEIDPYARLLADRLSRLPPGGTDTPLRVSVAGGFSLADSPAGRRVHALLHALARRLEAEATIRIVPALRRAGQAQHDPHERLSPSRAADIVYGAGIIGGSPGDRAGLHEWVPRLRRRLDHMRQLAAGSSAAEKRRDVRERQAATRWLRDVESLLPAIDALQGLAERVAAGVSLPDVWEGVRAFCARWLRIPSQPPTLLATLEQRLRPMLADAVAQSVSGPAALRLVLDLLQTERYQTARFGEPCVFIGTAAQAAGLRFTAVRLLGLAEGAVPHTPHDDPIVPDTLRQQVEDAARAHVPDMVLPRLADRVLDDIHDVFRVVNGAATRLALSAPRQWIDRSEREVSGIMLEVATALGRAVGAAADEGDVPTAARLRAAYLVPGRANRARHAAAAPLSPRALLAAATHSVPASWTAGGALAVDAVRRLAADGEACGSAISMLTDAWALAIPGLEPKRPISQSALTVLLTCPHRFLQERILYLKPPTRRPPTDVIAPMEYGSLFHAAAERFFHETGAALCRRDGTLEQWVARAREIAAAEFERRRETYPLRGSDSIDRERNRLLQQIEQLVQYEWQLPAREFLDSELSFGDPDAVHLALADGALYIWGAIDRVDRLGPAALAVRDMKTGRVRDFGEEPVNPGRDLQIGVYVLALEAMGYGGAAVTTAAYVHPSAAQEQDRAFAGNQIEQLRRTTRDWLDIARHLLDSGSFPRTPRSEDCTYCPFVPACGDGAQRRSAARLERLDPGDRLEPFARLKRKRDDDED